MELSIFFAFHSIRVLRIQEIPCMRRDMPEQTRMMFSFLLLSILLARHDLEQLALRPVAEAGEDSSSGSHDGATLRLNLGEDSLTGFHSLFLVDVDVHNEPPFVKGLIGQEILQALRTWTYAPGNHVSCMVLAVPLVAGSLEYSLLNPYIVGNKTVFIVHLGCGHISISLIK